jgi:hypothetical protein
MRPPLARLTPRDDRDASLSPRRDDTREHRFLKKRKRIISGADLEAGYRFDAVREIGFSARDVCKAFRRDGSDRGRASLTDLPDGRDCLSAAPDAMRSALLNRSHLLATCEKLVVLAAGFGDDKP